MRDTDGVALSSRNSYLNPAERAAAPAIFRCLGAARALFDAGERNAEALRQAMRQTIQSETLIQVDYVSVADPVTLLELAVVEKQALASMAVWLGATRLIDNLVLGA